MGFVVLARTLFSHYPKRAILGATLMITQSFLYNAIFFTYALVLTKIYGVDPKDTAYYFIFFALGNLAGPLVLGHLFDTVGRRRMIAGTYLLSGVLLAMFGGAVPGGCAERRDPDRVLDDYKRMRVDSILDKLDAGYKATTNLNAAGSDGKIIGSTFWSFGGVLAGVSPLSSSNVPVKFALSQNFPNPFNPTTTINYNLSKSIQVSLKIYDVLGREVATLVNGVQEAGQKTAVWDASHIASGVYFYKLVAGDFSDVKRMILLK